MDEWLRDGRAIALPDEMSTEFDRFLRGLPWLGAGLDWKMMPRAKIYDLSKAGLSELLQWLSTTRIGMHSHIAVWYSLKQGGIVLPLEKGVANLDELYRMSPGTRFAFGVDVLQEKLRPAYGDFLQYGSGDDLIAMAAAFEGE